MSPPRPRGPLVTLTGASTPNVACSTSRIEEDGIGFACLSSREGPPPPPPPPPPPISHSLRSGVLTRDLEGHGFQVASASSVHSALAALARRPADVVLTDLRLGGPDGLDLLKMLPRRVAEDAPDPHERARLGARPPGGDRARRDRRSSSSRSPRPSCCDRSTRRSTARPGSSGSVHGLSLYRHGADVPPVAALGHHRRHYRGRPAAEQDPLSPRRDRRRLARRRWIGCAALRAILATSSGALHTTGLEDDAAPTIDAPFDHLLLASLSRLDEELRDGRGRPRRRRCSTLGRPRRGRRARRRAGGDRDRRRASIVGCARSAAAARRARSRDRGRVSTNGRGGRGRARVRRGPGRSRRSCSVTTARRRGAAVGDGLRRGGGRELFGGAGCRLAGGRLHEVQLTATDHYSIRQASRRRRARASSSSPTGRSASASVGAAARRSSARVERPAT